MVMPLFRFTVDMIIWGKMADHRSDCYSSVNLLCNKGYLSIYYDVSQCQNNV